MIKRRFLFIYLLFVALTNGWSAGQFIQFSDKADNWLLNADGRIGVYVDNGDERGVPVKQQTPTQRRRAAVEETVQKRTSEPIVEMATLVRKSDDRLRVIESTGQVRLVDEYYELIFVTRKGQKLKIECSAEAYEKVPFNQQGSLTYKRNTLVKFKYYEDTVFN